VGRSKDKAYAYLLLSKGSLLTRDAEKRLKALMDFSHLGAGIHLAMHDLKIRGGGNILGFAQSGAISAIGYELYMKLIEQAVSELKGEEWLEDISPEINMDVTAFLPEDYVIDADVRLNFYRRLSSLREKSELEAMAEEIRDRFGPPSLEVRNLLVVMSIRLLLKKMGVGKLDVGQNSLTLTFSQSSVTGSERLTRMVVSEPSRFQFLSKNRLKIHMGSLAPAGALHQVEETINELSSFMNKL
jgi:transcription-repair coupling factor (superfamily II helicase)